MSSLSKNRASPLRQRYMNEDGQCRGAILNSFNHGVNTGRLSDDDAWGSDFEESIEELYSQEIEDNKINETREAELLKGVVANAQVQNMSSEDSRQISTAVTENTYCNVSSRTGAIPKRGFSYLDHSSVITQNNIQNNVVFQKIENSLVRDRNSQAILDVNNESNIKIVSPPASCSNETNQTLDTNLDSREKPAKLKEAVLSSYNRNSENLVDNFRNHKENKKDEIRLLVPNSFKPTHNKQRSQLRIDESVSHENESHTAFPSASPLIDTSNYEQIPEDIKILTPQVSKSQEHPASERHDLNGKDKPPPLPSRPPPIFRYASVELSKAKLPTKKPKLAEQNANLPAPQLVVRLPDSPKLVENTSLADVKISTDHKTTVKKTNSQTKPPTAKMTPEILSRPLPPIPVSNELDIRGDVLHAKGEQCGILGSGNLNAQITLSTSQAATSSLACPSFQSPSPVEKPIPYLQKTVDEVQALSESQSLHSKKTPQERLVEIIGNQSSVSTRVLQSQHKISSIIASKVSSLQKESINVTKNDSYERPIQVAKDDTECNLSDRISSTNQEKCRIMDSEKITEARRDSTQPSVYPSFPKPSQVGNSVPRQQMAISETHNSRTPRSPHMKGTPQQRLAKVIANQNNISASVLLSQHKVSSAIASKIANLQKGSARETNHDSYERPFDDIKEDAGYLQNSQRPRKSIPEIAKPSFPDKKPSNPTMRESSKPMPCTATSSVKTEVVPAISAQKNTLLNNAWYHDVDAWEAKRRLTFFLDEDGAFLIRPSTKKTNEIQYTACIVFSGRIINMHIRRKPSGEYAIGNEKDGEKTFLSLSDLIKYYKEVPIEAQTSLQPFSNSKSLSTCLRVTPPKI